MSSVPPGPPQGPPNFPPQGPPQGGPPQGGPPQGGQYPPQYGQPPQGYPQQQYPGQQYPQQYPMAGPPKKSNTLKIVLIIVGIVVFLGVAGISVTSYLVYRAVKNTGFDAELMQKNPGLAMTKMMATLHPDYQVISTDDSRGTVTVREKSTGKEMTFRWDPDKKTLVIVGDDGKEVKFSASGDGDKGTLTVDSADGKVTFGAGAGNNAPAWAPIYPGTQPQGTMSTQTGEGSQNTFTFKTHDPASKVLEYFKQQLTSSGFKITLQAIGEQGGMVTGADDGQKRTVMITAGSSSEGTEGSVTTIEKK